MTDDMRSSLRRMVSAESSEATKESFSLSISNESLPCWVNGWTEPAARSVLALDFCDRDRRQMLRLSCKADQAELTELEQSELDGFEQVSVFLEFLKRSASEFLRGNSKH